jgi:hypothetical protein
LGITAPALFVSTGGGVVVWALAKKGKKLTTIKANINVHLIEDFIKTSFYI